MINRGLQPAPRLTVFATAWGPHRMRRSILLVEDDQSLREVLRSALIDDGYDVWDVAEGAAALQLLDAMPVDLIVTDIHMAGLDGRGFISALVDRQDGTPILVMSALRHPDLEEWAVATLHKPFDLDTLLETIERTLADAPPR